MSRGRLLHSRDRKISEDKCFQPRTQIRGSDRTTMNDNNRASPLSHLIRDPVLLFFVILVSAGLALFILFPLYRILSYSVTSDSGGISFKAAVEVLTSQTYLKTFGNSLLLGAVTATISTLVGYVFAYALTRTAIPFKGFFKAIATIPVISPPFVLSLSMIFLFGRNGSITNKLLRN